MGKRQIVFPQVRPRAECSTAIMINIAKNVPESNTIVTPQEILRKNRQHQMKLEQKVAKQGIKHQTQLGPIQTTRLKFTRDKSSPH